MNEMPNLTSLRTSENILRYNINGRIYEFIVTKLDDGIPYGYCYKLHKWAWLYPDSVHAEGENRIAAIQI